FCRECAADPACAAQIPQSVHCNLYDGVNSTDSINQSSSVKNISLIIRMATTFFPNWNHDLFNCITSHEASQLGPITEFL
ncbi:hypothetical protein NQU39_26095, partial [Escherichia coli]|uniref:hypothetical protein n=1 Tax=Escherichia coli TaxID=562 RepID=UPI002118406B